MSISNLILWEKWRPQTIDDIILLPRIRKNFESGVNRNYVFFGHYGTGKTSLARILVGKYTKDKAYLEINSSLLTSIDTLRGEIEKFCKTIPMLETDDPIKYIVLDEFERVSPQYQDAMKAFMEHYHKNVRFILITNHLSKISDGIKSRCALINFDPESIEEEKYLKNEIFKRILNTISKEEEIEISKDQLISLINKKFPDTRSIILAIQGIKETGLDDNQGNVNNKLKTDLYKVLYDTSLSYEDTYHFLMSKFGADKIDVMMGLLGRPFVDWIIKEKNEDVINLFKCNYIISDYTQKLESNTDPIILGMTVIGKIKEILTGV